MSTNRACSTGRDLATHTLEHLAHELFHCVQRQYPVYHKNRGDWLIEGTAEAVGHDTAYALRGIEQERGPQFRWHARNYALPLARRIRGRDYEIPDAEKKNYHEDFGGYHTASFWRYLAEEAAARDDGGRAGVSEDDVDYAYLHHFFQTPGIGMSAEADADWLDSALEDRFGVGLEQVFPDFISVFADYVPERGSFGEATDEFDRQKWRDILFDGGCELESLSADAPTATTRMEIDTVAARCVAIDFYPDSGGNSGLADIDLHVSAKNRGTLEQLVIGTAGGDQVAQPIIVDHPELPGGGHFGSWRLRVRTGERQVFVISNVAEQPGDTYPVAIELQMTASGWGSSMTEPRPESPSTKDALSADDDPDAKGETPSRDAVRDSARETVETGLEAMSARSADGMSVEVKDDEPACDEPFLSEPCGPTTRIELSLMPGGALGGGASGLALGRGGLLGQSLAAAGAVRDTGVEESNSRALERMEEIAGTEGSMVSIAIPAIDYGFAGSFDNALIRVSAGEVGRFYESRGPEDIDPTSARRYPLKGRVTIEEFRPSVMRGRFSATLTDEAARKGTPGPDEALPVADTIDGRFVIAAPWRGDDRIEIDAGDVRERVLDDLAAANPAMAPMVAAARERLDAGGPTDGGPAGIAAGAVLEDTVEPADTALRAAYRRHWLDKGMPEAMLPKVMADFDAMTPAERRRAAAALGIQ